MLWSSSPTTHRFRSDPASNSSRRLWAKLVSWNSSTIRWVKRRDWRAATDGSWVSSCTLKEMGWPQLQQDVAHELPLAHLGHDAKPLWDAAEPALFLEKTLSEGVIGEDESLPRGEVVLLLDPVQHFARGLLREGQK